jgi:hypothetical protein
MDACARSSGASTQARSGVIETATAGAAICTGIGSHNTSAAHTSPLPATSASTPKVFDRFIAGSSHGEQRVLQEHLRCPRLAHLTTD